MISSAFLLLVSLCLLRNADAQIGITEDAPCGFGPDAMSAFFGKSIPRTCIEVPASLSESETSVKERCFYTYVPDSCPSSSAQKVPLVVDVHGQGACPRSMATYGGWKELAERDCFVIIWPSGDTDIVTDRACFNVPGFLKSDDFGNGVTTTPCCCADDGLLNKYGIVDDDTIVDPLFIKMAIDKAAESSYETFTKDSELSIDTSRVYMAGHSQGCVMSLTMGALYSDTVAAVCCHAGSLITPFAEDYSPVAYWMAVGKQDLTTPYEGLNSQLTDEILKIPGLDNIGLENFGFWGVEEIRKYLVDKNGCSRVKESDFFDPDSDATEPVGTLFRGSKCRNNADVEILALNDSGHNIYKMPEPWMEEQVRTRLETPTQTDTTALAWEFCSAHSKDESSGSSAPTPRSWKEQGVLSASLLLVLSVVLA